MYGPFSILTIFWGFVRESCLPATNPRTSNVILTVAPAVPSHKLDDPFQDSVRVALWATCSLMLAFILYALIFLCMSVRKKET